MGDALLPFPLSERNVHLCVDMQRIFSAEGPWPAPWTERVLPVVASLAGRHPERTVFTRFIPAERPDQMPGMWQRYYTRWRAATQPRLKFAGVDAASGGPLPSSDRHRKDALFRLRRAKAARASARAGSGRPDYIGSETDVCMLATVLSAVDIGYRVIVVRDAVCSSSDEGHDMLVRLYHTRFSEQIETADAETILSRWQ